MVDTREADELLEAEIPSSFSSDSAETEFWRRRTKAFERKWRETQEELEEFQTGSREFEAELEMQLDQEVAKAHELLSQNQKLARDNDSLRFNLESLQTETNKQISALADDLSSVSKTREDLAAYVREMEQKNDDLERSKRHMISSLEDFELRLNAALERNAFLESELEEKDQLQATIQRLKDESKDLRLEMTVKTKPVGGEGNSSGAEKLQQQQLQHRTLPHTTSSPNILGDSQTIESELKLKSLSLNDQIEQPQHHGTQSDQQQQQQHLQQQRHLQSHRHPVVGSIGTPSARPHQLGLTPNSRMVAMTLVGDLLQKVNALESRLATYRNHVRDKETPGSVVGGVIGVMKDGALITPTEGSVVAGDEGSGKEAAAAELMARAKVIETSREMPLLSPGNVTASCLTVIQPGEEEDMIL